MPAEPLMNDQLSLFAEAVAPRLSDVDAILAHARKARSEAFRGQAAAAGRFAKALCRPLIDAIARERAYRELMSLDDRVLADIGISRDQIPAVVAGELVRDPISAKPFGKLSSRPFSVAAVQGPAAPIARRSAA